MADRSAACPACLGEASWRRRELVEGLSTSKLASLFQGQQAQATVFGPKEEMRVRVYLDMCALKRPFDDQSDSRVWIESQAIITDFK